MRYRVIEDYQRCYATPITAQPGDHARIISRDDDVPGWRWCEHAVTKRGGWVADAFVEIDLALATVIFTRAYDAAELNIATGEILQVLLIETGWAWACNQSNEYGWVPENKLVALKDFQGDS